MPDNEETIVEEQAPIEVELDAEVDEDEKVKTKVKTKVFTQDALNKIVGERLRRQKETIYNELGIESPEEIQALKAKITQYENELVQSAARSLLSSVKDKVLDGSEEDVRAFIASKVALVDGKIQQPENMLEVIEQEKPYLIKKESDLPPPPDPDKKAKTKIDYVFQI